MKQSDLALDTSLGIAARCPPMKFRVFPFKSKLKTIHPLLAKSLPLATPLLTQVVLTLLQSVLSLILTKETMNMILFKTPYLRKEFLTMVKPFVPRY
jgi:hypothetical protein